MQTTGMDIDLERDEYRVIRPKTAPWLLPVVLAWSYGLGCWAFIIWLYGGHLPLLAHVIGTRQFWYTMGLSLALTIVATLTRRSRH
jgi:hypothetical protein